MMGGRYDVNGGGLPGAFKAPSGVRRRLSNPHRQRDHQGQGQRQEDDRDCSPGIPGTAKHCLHLSSCYL